MSDSESNSSENDEITSEEREKIKQRLSNLSFEELQKMKEEIGSKLYNETIFQTKSQPSKTTFKRANKNRPREMSSKRPVRLENNVIPVKHVLNRDPRFEPMCGTFDKKTFKKDYKFVNDLRKQEKTQLLKQLKETEDKKKIKFVIRRLENQIREEEKKERLEQEERKEKSEIKTKLKAGEKVHFKKRSVKRLEGLISKFEQLKKSNKLQKHLEKRSKKVSAKERKKLNNIS
ncbi:ribosomal RNA processing protein 36 homolog [Tribolium castaneum]|uniref:rRNA biogenesis protein RRP36 n=1 Tax=Tribolium castaneum TaxID=7070 RepID=D6WR63_TRICA|nr:PREDICTED: ribosomal RNA processing protein 36 homolog [Tribolium castaneum]EFA06004.1 Ribosomal RNA processing protein 36 homolog-like Protein [Tribolium castaneum]|eukprot:XP_975507.2 PREDICTED: ribosomal RNA processing protein 36 homolog [Tribolium castaneum]